MTKPPYNRTMFYLLGVGFLFFFTVAAFLTEHWYTGITSSVAQLSQSIQDLRVEIKGLQSTVNFVSEQVSEHKARILEIERRLNDMGMKRRSGSVDRAERVSAIPQIAVVEEQCTGFIAAPNIIFTARHCVDDVGDGAAVRFYDGLSRQFKIIAAGSPDAADDYAVLAGDTRGIEPLTIRKKAAEEGDVCAYAGYGAVRASQYEAPCRYLGRYEDTDMLYLAANIVGGDSGAPVVIEEKVVGIVTMSSYPIPAGVAVSVRRAVRAYQKWAAKFAK